MRKDLDRLAAEDERGDAVATVRGHDDQVAALQLCDIDDRPVGMLILDLDRLARDACCLRCVGDGTKSLFSIFLHTCFVPNGVSSIICVSVVNV